MEEPHTSPIMGNPTTLDLRLGAEPVICWCDPDDYGTKVYCDCSFSGDPKAVEEIDRFIDAMYGDCDADDDLHLRRNIG